MEEKDKTMNKRDRVQISRRARKLVSRAFVLGVAPLDLRKVVGSVIEDAEEMGRAKITRGDLKDLFQDVKSRFNNRVPNPVI